MSNNIQPQQTFFSEEFTNIYSVAKTLRFSVKPVGKTAENIKKDGIIETDRDRADDYKEAKKIIDEVHRDFIDNKLTGFAFEKDKEGKNPLEKYFEAYKTSSSSLDKAERSKQLEELANEMRKQIRKALVPNENKLPAELTGKPLIEKTVPTFLETNVSAVGNAEGIINGFKSFATYFTGFNENRANMYTEEAKATAIPYRLINENLPKFIDNIGVFDRIRGKIDGAEDLKDYFKIESYPRFITQIGIEEYNAVIGGYIELGDNKTEKAQGLNELINLYNQKQTERSERLPKFRPLFKQILSERDSYSWIPEKIKDDTELFETTKIYLRDIPETLKSLEAILNPQSVYQWDKIWVPAKNLSDISQSLFDNWSTLQDALKIQIANQINKNRTKYDYTDEKVEKEFIKRKSFSIEELQNAINSPFIELEKKDIWQDYFCAFKDKEDRGIEALKKSISSFIEIKALTNDSRKDIKDQIKSLLENIKNIARLVASLKGTGEEAEKDEQFYSSLAPIYAKLDEHFLLYDRVRNYFTQKPYSTDKFKLNFGNSTLMNGWDRNKEQDYLGILLRKENKYYFGIINKNNRLVFSEKTINNLKKSDNNYSKMVYKQIPKVSRDLPHSIYADTNKDLFMPSENIYRIKNSKSHKNETEKGKDDLRTIIDYYKRCLTIYDSWKHFDFILSETESYNTLDDFFTDVQQQAYKITFVNIPADYIDKLVDEGKLYLFEFDNKDFRPDSKGTPNLHTMYWRVLFDEENLKDVVFKLNGKAEIFFRPKSIKEEDIIRHTRLCPIKNKNPNNHKKQSTFDYDLVKDRRYTVDKYQFHVPITINPKARSNEGDVNTRVLEHIHRAGEDLHIIGIDRGERHLLYVSVINQRGEIVEQFSFNTINSGTEGQEHKTDYHHLLSEKADQRTKERQNWETVENIKELKEGYLSQVVHKICLLIEKYHAIVVLEKLNSGFKRSRQKVDFGVYQKFEKMLIDKLNLYINKQKDPDEYGGLLHPLQLTSRIDSFKDLETKPQTGILFYVPASYTSKIDPVTGFANFLDTKYQNIDKTKDFINRFDRIEFNNSNGRYEFAFDYKSFPNNKAEGTRTAWVVTTRGDRIETVKKNNRWDARVVDLTKCFDDLFDDYQIYDRTNLKEQICDRNEAEFFKRFLSLLRLTLQLRNSKPNEETDFILSPVADKDGHFFDSREKTGALLPENADANGAYNIALKGLMYVRRIKDFGGDFSKKEELKEADIFSIPLKDWLRFIQEKPFKQKSVK